ASLLLDVYEGVFSHHGLDPNGPRKQDLGVASSPLYTLIFSNLLVWPDEFNFRQPYQVAQALEKQRLNHPAFSCTITCSKL
ncbi:hypothetical protein, partial [Hymenobacter sp. AT01-02]|uniref:hypothetical protein n=1 Tax=Hymenobacter sp. AT01-02 TaxID=1571877 RepID=UPI000AD0FB6A